MVDSDLVARVREEQKRSWAQGDGKLLEAFLANLPELKADEIALGELVFEEYLLRWEHGEIPSVTEYEARFPGSGFVLELRLGLYQELPEHAVRSDEINSG